VASDLDVRQPDVSRLEQDDLPLQGKTGAVQSLSAAPAQVRIDQSCVIPDEARYPAKLTKEVFYGVTYPLMFLSRRLEERMLELFQKGYVKGTVTLSIGNEGTTVGMAAPFRPGRDVVSLLHRDFAAHLLLGSSPYQLACQYMANAESPTHGREGNVHHGDASMRRLPMISHLGKMLSLAVGGTWAARQHGEEVFGLAVIGDGGSSTGEFHEALNIASVHNVPVVFLVENNHFSFSTPTDMQYNCEHLSDRAHGYGISGWTIDGTDPWEVYSTVWDTLDVMRDDPAPAIIECMSIRLHGHAAYDKAEYVSKEQMQRWRRDDPLPKTRRKLQEVCGMSGAEIGAMEAAVDEQVHQAVTEALRVPRPKPSTQRWKVYAASPPMKAKPLKVARAKNGEAVNRALDYILANDPRAFFAGLDIGTYGSAFKTCKGLIDRHGPDRVIDMPICESATVGFALGATQVGGRPIIEFQFADFSTEAVTQLGLNAGTWYFRTGSAVPMLLRLPCGGGMSMGAFHSGEYEGLWSRFPGLKVIYPATPQETYEALLAGFYDQNPCLVLEHKLLYWSRSGPIDFDGNLADVWRARQHREGTDVTVVAFGAMVHEAMLAATASRRSLEVLNPFVVHPIELGPILASVEKTGRLLVVQESGATGGLGHTVISRVVGECGRALKCPPRLIASPDMPLPFAPELESDCRPGAARIEADVERMFEER